MKKEKRKISDRTCKNTVTNITPGAIPIITPGVTTTIITPGFTPIITPTIIITPGVTCSDPCKQGSSTRSTSVAKMKSSRQIVR